MLVCHYRKLLVSQSLLKNRWHVNVSYRRSLSAKWYAGLSVTAENCWSGAAERYWSGTVQHVMSVAAKCEYYWCVTAENCCSVTVTQNCEKTDDL